MPSVKVLLVSPDPSTREMTQLAVADLRRGEEVEFLEAIDGERGIKLAWREAPDVIVADEIASRAGAFALCHELHDAPEPFTGAIVVLLERPHDAWLAEWSGADAWFVKPVDAFALSAKVRELAAAIPA